MKLPTRTELIPLGFCTLILLILGIIGSIFTNTSVIGLFSLLFAIFFYLILPGYFVMLNFNFDALERIILGIIVSSALIPAILYGINILGFKINTTLILFSIFAVISLTMIYRAKEYVKS